MNTKPADSPACTAAGLTGGGSSVFSLSKKGNFLVQTGVKTSAGVVLSQPQVGDNLYVIHLVHGEDMHPVSQDAVITITYTRPNSTSGKTFTADVQKQADGSFTSTITFKRPGNWEIDIHVTDGSVQDDQSIVVTIQ